MSSERNIGQFDSQERCSFTKSCVFPAIIGPYCRYHFHDLLLVLTPYRHGVTRAWQRSSETIWRHSSEREILVYPMGRRNSGEPVEYKDRMSVHVNSLVSFYEYTQPRGYSYRMSRPDMKIERDGQREGTLWLRDYEHRKKAERVAIYKAEVQKRKDERGAPIWHSVIAQLAGTSIGQWMEVAANDEPRIYANRLRSVLAQSKQTRLFKWKVGLKLSSVLVSKVGYKHYSSGELGSGE